MQNKITGFSGRYSNLGLAGWHNATSVVAFMWMLLTAVMVIELTLGNVQVSPAIYARACLVVVAAWAVMERKRWGRVAILGIALSRVCDGVLAGWALLQVELVPHSLVSVPVYRAVPRLFGCGEWFGVAMLLTAIATVFWLRANPAKEEFGWKKVNRTAKLQYVIGIALTTLFILINLRFGLCAAVDMAVQGRDVPWLNFV